LTPAQVVSQLLKARAKAGLKQDAVAEWMGSTKCALSLMESVCKHAASLGTLQLKR
jgi:hypothetical protein